MPAALVFTWPKGTLSAARHIFRCATRGAHAHNGAERPKTEWEAVIGLEIHAKLASRTKLFSPSPSCFEASPNTNVGPFDVALPGTLPVLNKECMVLAVRGAVALNCRIAPRCSFDRKHYFYHDLPHGYQITQYHEPLAVDGFLDMEGESDAGRLRITRVHMEQDSAKTLNHAEIGEGQFATLIDYNRAGVGLIEIVTEPSLRNGKEAAAALGRIQRLLCEAGACDGHMEEGAMRCDANVSIRPRGDPRLGLRTEIKNIGSLRSLQLAIDSEVDRQIALCESGYSVARQTLGFDKESMQTRVLRDKEDSLDYRFLPDFDLPVVFISDAVVQKIRDSIPLTLKQKCQAFLLRFPQFSNAEASKLLTHPPAMDYFESLAAFLESPRQVYHWITNELFGHLGRSNLDMGSCPISIAQLGSVFELLRSGAITSRIAKDILSLMIRKRDPRLAVDIAREHQLIVSRASSDSEALNQLCEKLIQSYPEQVLQIRRGKIRFLQLFMGEIMKATNGKADPILADKLLREKIGA